jgi:RimJ/RimL family protein N-acetyltransferase
VKHAFDTVRLPRMTADIATENQASLHIAQKLGMQWVGYDACDGMRYERYRLARDDLR